jgi:amino acid transporter
MYNIEGFDVYFTWVIVGVISSIVITIVNYLGVKTAAFLQGVLTILIAIIGLTLVCGSVVNGNPQNLKPLFMDGSKGILAVAVMTPFMYVGFDIIPQAAEEINVPLKKIGEILILSVVMAVIWYIVIIVGVSLALTEAEMKASTLVTADAMAKVFMNSSLASKILIIGGIGGILTSWNSFYIGGSRAIFSMAESKMLPTFLAKIHPKYKTPCNSVLLVGAVSAIAPLFGKKMLGWLVDAGGLTIVVAYLIVSISFLVLRKKEPNMARPYKVKHGKFVGLMACILSAIITILYFPGAPAALIWPYEWGIIIFWSVLGAVFYGWAKISNAKAGINEYHEFKKILEENYQDINEA